ncbi:hypothetical protein ES705_49514 [subsurface metagenome]
MFSVESVTWVCRQKKQVCGSEGTVVGRAGTLLLCVMAINQFFKERWQNKNPLN